MIMFQKIHEMKWLQIVISIILCFAVMCCAMSKAVEVKAVIGIDDGIFWAIVAALAEMGIRVVVTDPFVREAIADFFWSAVDQVREDIEVIASFVRVGYAVYYDAAVDAWSRIAHAIENWFTTERYPQSSILHGDISTSNGVIDFYTANSFSFTFPTISTSSNTTSIVEFALNDCIITFYFNPTNDFYYSLVGESSSDTSVKSGWCAFVIAPLNSNVRLVCRGELSYLANVFSLSAISGKTFYNLVWSSYYADDGQYRYGLPIRSSDSSVFKVFFSPVNYQSTSCFMFGGTYCDLYGSRGQSFYFRNSSTGANVLGDVTFVDGLSALAWFFDQCGIDVRRGGSSVYAPGQVNTDPIVIDPAVVSNAVDIIDSLPADSTVPVILPSTPAQYEQIVSDVPVSNLYDAEIDMPTVNGNLWKTKFPFCIPFDLINLFSGFSAEVQAPSFHVLVMPANSFGLDNDDIYWDIDFQPYNYLVQILRFFLALSFVLWLIVITRKLIRG